MAAVPTVARAIGNEVSSVLSSSITDSDTSITVADATGFNAAGGFVIIDEGISGKEEVVYVESVAGNILTVATSGRGQSGTSATSHDIGATITDILVAEHVNGIRSAFLLEHDDDGGHKQIDGAITASGTAASASNKVVDSAAGEWSPISTIPTRQSADDPTYVLRFAADMTSTISVGMKLAIMQTTAKYFIVTVVGAFTDGNTDITVYGGTDYDVDDTSGTPITGVKYSGAKAPFGFPTTPSKWEVLVTDTSIRTQNSPTTGTWYNIGGSAEQIIIPIGVWVVEYIVGAQAAGGSGSTNIAIYTTLSTANNTQSDTGFTVRTLTTPQYIEATHYRNKMLNLVSKTTYYLNTKSDFSAGSMTIYNAGNVTDTIIRAKCAYL